MQKEIEDKTSAEYQRQTWEVPSTELLLKGSFKGTTGVQGFMGLGC